MIKREILRYFVIVVYTEVFGVYSGWAYYKSWKDVETINGRISKGNLWMPIALHSHCNWLGLPNFGAIFDKTTYLPRKLAIVFFYLNGIILFCICKNYLV